MGSSRPPFHRLGGSGHRRRRRRASASTASNLPPPPPSLSFYRPTPRRLRPRPPPRASGIRGVAVEDAGRIHDVAIVAVAIAIVAVVAVARDVAPPSFAGGCIVLVSGRLARPICGGVRPAAAAGPAPLLLPLPLLSLRLPRGGGRRGPSSPSVIRSHRRRRRGGRGVVHGQCRGGPQRRGGWLGRE